jgi:hypothetical protein
MRPPMAKRNEKVLIVKRKRINTKYFENVFFFPLVNMDESLVTRTFLSQEKQNIVDN